MRFLYIDIKLVTMGRRDPETFLQWLHSIRCSRILLIGLLVLLMVPLLFYYYLTRIGPGIGEGGPDMSDTARRVLGLIEFDHLSGPEIKDRIDELIRIKNSVQVELQKLEQRRAGSLKDIAEYSKKIEVLKVEASREKTELDRLKMSIHEVKVAQAELIERNTPEIKPPHRLLATADHNYKVSAAENSPSCRMHNCFDFSRCSITSGFPVYFYNTKSLDNFLHVDSILSKDISQYFSNCPYRVVDPDTACLFVVLVGERSRIQGSGAVLTKFLENLSHWNGDGRNHIILSLSRSAVSNDTFSGANTGRAMLVQSQFSEGQYRDGFDLVASPAVSGNGQEWQQMAGLVPLVREYLLSFHGEHRLSSFMRRAASDLSLGVPAGQQSLVDNVRLDQFVVDQLEFMKQSQTSDKLHLEFSCTVDRLPGLATDWDLCGSEAGRADVLKRSTFNLVISPSNKSLLSTSLLQFRLYEALKYGTIPVVLGDHTLLPLSDFIDWHRAALVLPKARITELHYLLRTFPDNDLYELRRQGRMLIQTYFINTNILMDTILATFRTRLSIPAHPQTDLPSPSVFNKSFTPLLMDHLPVEAEPDESLGPLEPPFASPSFRRNYSGLLTQTYHTWNIVFSPLVLPPYTPWEPVLPSEAKFLGSGHGFRPVSGGEGGAGKEFSQALGGNLPQEQFTVVMLTYEREHVLMNSLARLYGLPYLNKVVVVWNSAAAPADDLRWPDIGVPIHVVRTERNSLNNRFLPYDAIETEAVLSVDDDAHLRHDEIIFGFRVWREHRDQLVGFPGRFHAWDLNHTSWNYNSNYSCELSMVLTGAAFYHKYYSYLYTYSMPEAIRDMVDSFMNCEDLAMNFLISHVTRKPPVKVTSRWTFRCPGCPVSLSEDDSHFQERHKCINYFSKVFGYMPLLYTQYRADSVLFKTRLPPDKQKCFKFI